MSIARLGIVGSGIMGSGIAEVAAKAGIEVVLRSRKQATADAMVAALEKSLNKQVEKGKLEEQAGKEVLARVSPHHELHALAGCDLVLESVVEDLEVKKELFARLSDVLSDDAIIATNTSTLPVVELAAVVENPARVCGIHFFNPAPMMSLVEIVRPLTASDATIAAAAAFAQACGKTTVEVQEDIDTAMKGGCNFPMGPLALLDLVGLDTSLAILDALYAECRDPNYAALPTLRRMVAAGHLGRKTGQGFYSY